VDNQDIADAMDMLERSQDEQRQRLEAGPVAKGAVAINVGSQQSGHQRDISEFVCERCSHITFASR
jgi:hypothetical protein